MHLNYHVEMLTDGLLGAPLTRFLQTRLNQHWKLPPWLFSARSNYAGNRAGDNNVMLVRQAIKGAPPMPSIHLALWWLGVRTADASVNYDLNSSGIAAWGAASVCTRGVWAPLRYCSITSPILRNVMWPQVAYVTQAAAWVLAFGDQEGGGEEKEAAGCQRW